MSNLLENIRVAVDALFINKLRAALTTLGIGIGITFTVSVVIALVLALGSSMPFSIGSPDSTTAAVNAILASSLVQQMAATEALAAVDTICVDKTGTLTDGTLELAAVEVADTTPPAISGVTSSPGAG